jgi:hypothetical protein
MICAKARMVFPSLISSLIYISANQFPAHSTELQALNEREVSSAPQSACNDRLGSPDCQQTDLGSAAWQG